jgi:hypothetical protein
MAYYMDNFTFINIVKLLIFLNIRYPALKMVIYDQNISLF